MDIKTVCSVTSKPSIRVEARALFRDAYSRSLMDFCSFQISKNPCRKGMDFLGATERTWTAGLLITNQLLYRLSYSSISYENWLFRHTLFLVYHTSWLLKRNSLTTTGDLLITNQLLYRLSYTSISIFDSDHNTIFLSQRQHPFQFSPSMRLSCFCILLYVLLQVFLQNKCCHFFILHFRVIVNCGKIEKICRCISAIQIGRASCRERV